MISTKTHYSFTRAGRELAVNRATLQELIDQGRLTAIKIPGSIGRIPKVEVDALIAESTRKATRPAGASSAA